MSTTTPRLGLTKPQTTDTVSATIGTDLPATIDILDNAILTTTAYTAGDLTGSVGSSPTVAAGAIGTTKLADDAVTAAKIATGAVGTTEIADASVTAAKLAALSVAAANIIDGTITAVKLGADSVTATQIATDAVGAAEIAAGAVGTAELATDAVTQVKIANAAVGIAEINATGTASSSTYLRGDGAWATVAAGGTVGFINAEDYGLTDTDTVGTTNRQAMRDAIDAARDLAVTLGVLGQAGAQIRILAGRANRVYTFTSGRGDEIVVAGRLAAAFAGGRWCYALDDHCVVDLQYGTHRLVTGYNQYGTSASDTFTTGSYTSHGFVTCVGRDASETSTQDCGIIRGRFDLNGDAVGGLVGSFQGLQLSEAERLTLDEVYVHDGFGMNGSGSLSTANTVTNIDSGQGTTSIQIDTSGALDTSVGAMTGSVVTFVSSGGVVRGHGTIASAATTSTNIVCTMRANTTLTVGDSVWYKPNYEAFGFDFHNSNTWIARCCLAFNTGAYGSPSGGYMNSGFSSNYGTNGTHIDCHAWNLRNFTDGATAAGTGFTSYRATDMNYLGCRSWSVNKPFNVEYPMGRFNFTDCHGGMRIGETNAGYTTQTTYADVAGAGFGWLILGGNTNTAIADGPGVDGGDIGAIPTVELTNCTSTGFTSGVRVQVSTNFRAATGTTGTTVNSTTSVFDATDVGRLIQIGAGPVVRIADFVSATSVTTDFNHGGATDDCGLTMGAIVKVNGGVFADGAQGFEAGSGGWAKTTTVSNTNATGGDDVTVTTSAAFFTAGDVGQAIEVNAQRGVIKSFTSSTSVVAVNIPGAWTAADTLTVGRGERGDALALQVRGETVYRMTDGWGDGLGPRASALQAHGKYAGAASGSGALNRQQCYPHPGALMLNPYSTDATLYIGATGAVTWAANGIQVRGPMTVPVTNATYANNATNTVIPGAACPAAAGVSTAVRVPAGGGILLDYTASANLTTTWARA